MSGCVEREDARFLMLDARTRGSSLVISGRELELRIFYSDNRLGQRTEGMSNIEQGI